MATFTDHPVLKEMMGYRSKNENQTMLAFTTYLQFCEGKYIMWNVGHEFLSTLDLIVIKASKKNNIDVEVHLPISAHMEISPEWMQQVNNAVETTLGVDKVKILLCEGDSKFVGYTIQGGLQVVSTETEQTSNNKQQTFIKENLLKRNSHYIYEEAKKKSESNHDTEIEKTDHIKESDSNKDGDKTNTVCISTDDKKDNETKEIKVTEEKQKDPEENESENLSECQNKPEILEPSSKDCNIHNEENENKTSTDVTEEIENETSSDMTHEEENNERRKNDDNMNVKEEKECNDPDKIAKENNVTTNDNKIDENRTDQAETRKDNDCTNELKEKHEVDAVESNKIEDGKQNGEDDKIEKSQLDEKETDKSMEPSSKDLDTLEIGQNEEKQKNNESEEKTNVDHENKSNTVLDKSKVEKEEEEEEETQSSDENDFNDENENDEYKELVQTEENEPTIQEKTLKEKLNLHGKKLEKIPKKIKKIQGKTEDKKESQVIDISSSDENDDSSNDEEGDSDTGDSSDQGETDSDIIELSDNSDEEGTSKTKNNRTRDQESESSDIDTSSLSNSDIEEIQVINKSGKKRHKNWKDKKKEKKAGDDLEVLYEVDDRKSFFASQIVEVVYSNSLDDDNSNSMPTEDAVEIVFEKEGKQKKKRQGNSKPDLSQFSSKKKRFFQY